MERTNWVGEGGQIVVKVRLWIKVEKKLTGTTVW